MSEHKGPLILVALLVLATFVTALQTSRLQTERAKHAATTAILDKERTLTALLTASNDAASASIAALQGQVRSVEAARAAEREQAAKRATVLRDVQHIPPAKAGVVDPQTSKKAVEHINEALTRHSRF